MSFGMIRLVVVGLVTALVKASSTTFAGHSVSFERCEAVESFELDDATGLFERKVKHVVSFSVCKGWSDRNHGLCLGLYQAGVSNYFRAVQPVYHDRLTEKCSALCASEVEGDSNDDDEVCNRCLFNLRTSSDLIAHPSKEAGTCVQMDKLMELYQDVDPCISCHSESDACHLLEASSKSCAGGGCSITATGLSKKRRLDDTFTVQFIRTVPPIEYLTAQPTTAGRAEPTIVPTTRVLDTVSPTVAPTTLAPVTAAPVAITAAPTMMTASPVTSTPVTRAPVTSTPVTIAPITSIPTSPMGTPSPSTAPSLAPLPATVGPTTFGAGGNELTIAPTAFGVGGNELTIAPTVFGVGGNEIPQGVTDCGCYGCTNDVLNLGTDSDGSGPTCRERMSYLMQEESMPERAACIQVSDEFPNICGQACDPDSCVLLAELPTQSPAPGAPVLPSKPMITCGCSTCTANALSQIAGPEYDGNYSCGDRIIWLITTQGKDETASCSQVSREFPDICGVQCDPATCDVARDATDGKNDVFGLNCGCEECDDDALNAMSTDGAGTYSCGARILWLMENYEMAEIQACERVAAELPDACASSCSRATCTKIDESTPAPRPPEVVVDCGCPTCSSESLDQPATDAVGTSTCRERITWLLTEMGMTELGACRRVGLEFPDVCGFACNPDVCRSPIDCGCPSTCTSEVLGSIAGPEYDGYYSCRARIAWLKETQGLDTNAACRQVSSEFPTICGAGCNPDTCVNPQMVAMIQLSAAQDGTATSNHESASSSRASFVLMPATALATAIAYFLL